MSVTFIQYINRIHFGFGAFSEIHAELVRLDVARPLVITDRGVVAAGLLERVVAALPDGMQHTVYDGTESNPHEAQVTAALEVYRSAGCDGLIAVGGGSVIDCAKAVALLLTHGGELADYVAHGPQSELIVGPMAPLIALPTTAGTGSEVGRGMGVSLRGGSKAVFLSPHLIPAVAICDPGLTLGLPPALTAATGIDAFSHGLEAFMSPRVNPPADAIAIDAIQRLRTYLPEAYIRGGDREARWQVMMGALEAAMTTWKGLGAAHALAIPFDDLGLHHGTVIGLVLPSTVQFSLREVSAEKVRRLEGALGGPVVPAVRELVEALKLPSTLHDVGLAATDLKDVGRIAANSAFNATAARRGTAQEYDELARVLLTPAGR